MEKTHVYFVNGDYFVDFVNDFLQKKIVKPKDLYNVFAYDPEGRKFTIGDFNNGLVKYKPARNFLWKKRKEINKMLINEHRVNQGLESLRFRKNRGVKARAKAQFYCNRNYRKFD